MLHLSIYYISKHLIQNKIIKTQWVNNLNKVGNNDYDNSSVWDLIILIEKIFFYIIKSKRREYFY